MGFQLITVPSTGEFAGFLNHQQYESSRHSTCHSTDIYLIQIIIIVMRSIPLSRLKSPRRKSPGISVDYTSPESQPYVEVSTSGATWKSFNKHVPKKCQELYSKEQQQNIVYNP